MRLRESGRAARQRKHVAARGEEQNKSRVCGNGCYIIPHLLQHLLGRGGVLIHTDEMSTMAVKRRGTRHQRQRRLVRAPFATRLPTRRGGEDLVFRGGRIQSRRNVVIPISNGVAFVRRGEHGVTERETRSIAPNGESSFIQHRGIRRVCLRGSLLEGGGEEGIEVVERLVGRMHGGGELGRGGLAGEERVKGCVQGGVCGMEKGARDRVNVRHQLRQGLLRLL